MTTQTIGYIRVSSESQNTARQLQGMKLDKTFTDTVTGSNIDRQELQACINYARESDTIVIDSIDRLARNLRDLQELIEILTTKGVTVKFVKENLTFTGNDDPMSKLMLQMMGAFAEFERSLIRSRQREGIDAAKKAGKHLGRPATVDAKFIAKAKEYIANNTSIRQTAMRMGVSRATIYKALSK